MLQHLDGRISSNVCTFTTIIDKHLPLVTKRIKKQPEWINNCISLAIKKRENEKKYKDEHNYKHWRNETTRLIRDAKKHITHILHTQKLSKVFNELNNKSSDTTNIKSITYNNKTYTNDNDIANSFNEYFTSVTKKFPNKDNILSPNLHQLGHFISTKLPKGNIFNIPQISQKILFTNI